jgi:malonate-semialdehyde dehydrogenase (acetylating)/methylmalonate-semialdehyde dehydrogenase
MTTSVPVIQHFINGRIVESTSERRQDVFNPATGAVAAQVVLASVDEVNQAVAAASAAAPAWAATAPMRWRPRLRGNTARFFRTPREK